MSTVAQAWYIGGSTNAPLFEKVFGESLRRLDALPLEVSEAPALLVLDLSEPAAMEGLLHCRRTRRVVLPVALLSARRLGGVGPFPSFSGRHSVGAAKSNGRVETPHKSLGPDQVGWKWCGSFCGGRGTADLRRAL